MHYVVQLSHAYNTWSNIMIDTSNGILWPAGRTSDFAVHLQKHSSSENVDTSEAVSPGIVQTMCHYTMWCSALSVASRYNVCSFIPMSALKSFSTHVSISESYTERCAQLECSIY